MSEAFLNSWCRRPPGGRPGRPGRFRAVRCALPSGLEVRGQPYQSNVANCGTRKWVCLKIGYIPNEIAIFHRDNDQQNHWV